MEKCAKGIEKKCNMKFSYMPLHLMWFTIVQKSVQTLFIPSTVSETTIHDTEALKLISGEICMYFLFTVQQHSLLP